MSNTLLGLKDLIFHDSTLFISTFTLHYEEIPHDSRKLPQEMQSAFEEFSTLSNLNLHFSTNY